MTRLNNGRVNGCNIRSYVLNLLGYMVFLFVPFETGCHNNYTASVSCFKNSVGMDMVMLSSGYGVSKYETRQAEFERVMGYNPSMYRNPENPVENLTGAEAEAFCTQLTRVERDLGRLPEGYVYTLPTYEQWLQYNAGASLKGSITPFGEDGISYDRPQPTGSGEVNRLGLFDLRGNVSEWGCERYSTGSNLVLGPFWNEYRDDFLRINNRAGLMSSLEKGPNVGFRCVLVRLHK